MLMPSPRTILLALGAALFVTATPRPKNSIQGRLAAPSADLMNGAYLVDLNPDGTTSYTPITPTNNTHSDPLPAPRLIVRSSGSHCPGHYMNSKDLRTAIARFLDVCNDGFYFEGHTLAVTHGTAVVYACNYGKGQKCVRDDVKAFHQDISSSCGAGNAGWYVMDEWKAAYGRDSQPSGFC